MDNLESHTYEVFEKDPVKYSEYQKAIFYALRDRVPDSEARARTTYVACLLTFDLLHNFRFTDWNAAGTSVKGIRIWDFLALCVWEKAQGNLNCFAIACCSAFWHTFLQFVLFSQKDIVGIIDCVKVVKCPSNTWQLEKL